ncbi:SRTD2 protein, partial [Crypturellus soui]|nr:SRTD2 protein [Crypturellus soui]
MLGKGGKRKFDEHEDGLEGKVVSPTDGPSKVSYTLQRQTIFNISLMKLYNQRPLTEPSLQKTVLINNMLRRIQEELKQEGGLRPVLVGTAPPAEALPEGFREAQALLPAELAAAAPLDACLTPASLLEDDALLAPPPTCPPAPTDSFSSALEEIEELCPAPAAATKGHKAEGPAESRTAEVKPAEPSAFEITTSTGFLTDLTLDDILFADIDTSMYDFDPCTSATGAASKMTPVSADELLKTLAPYSSQPVTPNQPFKMDLTELDHIMEVLVGS